MPFCCSIWGFTVHTCVLGMLCYTFITLIAHIYQVLLLLHVFYCAVMICTCIVCIVQLARVSQELLMSICMNCGDKDGGDLEVMTSLIKMRMKTKPLINHYLACIRWDKCSNQLCVYATSSNYLCLMFSDWPLFHIIHNWYKMYSVVYSARWIPTCETITCFKDQDCLKQTCIQ